MDSGLDQLFIRLHFIHEVTSPQAFAMIEERGLGVMYPSTVWESLLSMMKDLIVMEAVNRIPLIRKNTKGPPFF